MTKRTWRQVLHKPVSIAPLVTLRIVFGILMMAGTARFMALGWIDDHYVMPKMHFKYFGFGWVEPLPSTGLWAVHWALLAAALCMTLGLFYRLSATLVFLLFTYTELIDITYYLNHYYFVSVMSLLLVVAPAHRAVSLDVRRKPSLYRTHVPAWCVGMFKAQIGIVYVCAGLVKINATWLLDAMPLKIWLPAADRLPVIGPIFSWKATPYIFSWAGMVYDCTIVFFLLNRRTRVVAWLSVVVFHGLTGMLFQIGVFPVVMIGAALVFFSDGWHKRLLEGWAARIHPWHLRLLRSGTFAAYAPDARAMRFARPALAVFFLFQIFFPWRFLLYSGNMLWTEEGYRFGWRVMLMEKAGTATFYVKDSRTGREGVVFNSDFLNPHQEKQMAMQPDMILQYAHFLGRYYAQHGVYKPSVRAEVWTTLNAQPSRLLVDDRVDLMKVEDGWGHKNWVTAWGR